MFHLLIIIIIHGYYEYYVNNLTLPGLLLLILTPLPTIRPPPIII